MGERLSRPTGTFTIKDETNKLIMEVKMAYERTGAMKSISNSISGFFGKKSAEPEKKPLDWFDVTIYKVNSFDPEVVKSDDYMKMKVSEGCGNYCEFVQMDGNIIWQSNDKIEDWVTPEGN